MSSLTGKIAIVTGGAGGIGSATAKLLAERGAAVAVADINADAAAQVADAIKAMGGNAIALRLDLAEEESIAAMIRDTVSTFGGLDILDNNAAALTAELSARDGNIEEMAIEVWGAIYRVNIRGTMLACKFALPELRKRGGGAIINTASNLALQGNLIQAAYSSSKAAVIQLTRAIATSHGRYGIRCNTVSPGMTMSRALMEHLPARLRQIVESETLTPYLGDPIDIAHAVAFLASDEARYINGHNLVADGGTAYHIPGYAALREFFGQGDTP